MWKIRGLGSSLGASRCTVNGPCNAASDTDCCGRSLGRRRGRLLCVCVLRLDLTGAWSGNLGTRLCAVGTANRDGNPSTNTHAGL